MSKLVIDDIGMIEVTIGGETKPIDAYRVYNLIAEIDGRVKEEFPADGTGADAPRRQAAYWQAVRELLGALGFAKAAEMTDWAVDYFDGALAEAVNELGNALTSAPKPA
jgi:hypothetical protein